MTVRLIAAASAGLVLTAAANAEPSSYLDRFRTWRARGII